MRSKIVIIGAGCAPTRGQGPPRTPGVQVSRESDHAPQASPSAQLTTRQPQRPPQVAASGDSGRHARSARAPAARRHR